MSAELRNPEFEAEIEKNTHLRTYVRLGKEEAEDFNKTFQLNWTYRNDFAKTLITLSSGMLALLASLSSTSLLRAVPTSLILVCMILLLLTIIFNVASLWTIIEVTRVAENFIEQAPEFKQRFEKMIQEYNSFEPKAIDDLFRVPFEKACKSHDDALNYLYGGIILFVLSLIVLSVVGLKAIPSYTPISSIQRSIVSSPQSFGSHTGAKCLKNK